MPCFRYKNGEGIDNGDANLYGAVGSPAEISLMDNARYSYASLRRVSRMWVSDTSDMLDYTQRVYQPDVTLAGLQVLTSGRGFLRDGSRYIDDVQSTLPAILEREADNFEQGQMQFQSGQIVSERAIAVTQSILELAQANDITVIGILPPYRPSYYDPMMASGDFEYMPLAVDALQELFAGYDVPFLDYTDPRIIGGSEAEMTDSWHFTDLLSLRIYYDLLTRYPEILAEFSDTETLSTWLTEYQDYSLDLFMVDLP